MITIISITKKIIINYVVLMDIIILFGFYLVFIWFLFGFYLVSIFCSTFSKSGFKQLPPLLPLQNEGTYTFVS